MDGGRPRAPPRRLSRTLRMPAPSSSVRRNRARSRSRRALTNIRAITFDVGSTLIQCWPSVGHIYADIAARHGCVGLSPRLLNRRFAAAWQARGDFRHTRDEWAALVDATFDGLTPEPPGKLFFPELYDAFSRAAAWRVFPEVRPVLEALAAGGLKLGVISNWDDRLRPLLARLKLDPYFVSIVVSCEVNAPKPAPLIFERAARELSLPPREILHVGDDRVMDVQGARAAGFNARLLARRRAPAGDAMRSLRELLPLIQASPTKPRRGLWARGSAAGNQGP